MASTDKARTVLLGAILTFAMEAYCEEEYFNLDIPAQDAAQALDILAKRTGHSLLIPSEGSQQIHSKAIVGRYSLRNALDALLRDTPLDAIVTEHGAIVVSVDKEKTQSKLTLFADQIPAQENTPLDTRHLTEEMLVRGIRHSLNDALNIKRNAEGIVAAVSEEDIGKLPDETAARAMHRIPGIQISIRDGEGSEIQVRGLSQVNVEFNNVSYVGVPSLINATVRRNTTFEDIPAELLSGIEVLKSPSADHIEGAIGATVRLKTRQPLDMEGLQFSATANHIQSHLADSDDEKYSLLFGNNWGDKFGLLLSATTGTSIARNDHLSYKNWDGLTFGANSLIPSLNASTENLWTDPSQDPSAVCRPNCWRNVGWSIDEDNPSQDIAVSNGGFMPTLMHLHPETGKLLQVIAPQYIELSQTTVARDRTGLNLSLQARPTSQIELYADILANKYLERKRSTVLSLGIRDTFWPQNGIVLDESITPFTFGAYTDGSDVPQTSAIKTGDLNSVDGEITLLSGGFTAADFNHNGDNHIHSGQATNRDVRNYNLRIGGLWSSDDTSIDFRYGKGRSSVDDIEVRQDLSGSYGNTNCAWRDVRPLDPHTGQAVDCANNIRWGYDLSAGSVGSITLDPSVRGVNPGLPDGGDLLTDPYSYALGFVSLWVNRLEVEQDEFAVDFNHSIDKTYGHLRLTSLDAGIRTSERDNKRRGETGIGRHYREECAYHNCGEDTTDQRWGAEDGNSIYVQPPELLEAIAINDGSYLSDTPGDFPRQWITPHPSAYNDPLNDVYRLWGIRPVHDPLNDWSVEERTQAAYIKANFKTLSGKIDGNIGIRATKTLTRSENTNVRFGANSIALFTDLYLPSDYFTVEAKREYTDILPSATVNWALTPETKLRLSAASVMSRPDLTDLNSGVFITSAKNRTGIIGNPDLQPYRGNQAEASIEWYFDEGGLLASSVFYKDISSFITHDYSVTFTQLGRWVDKEGNIIPVEFSARQAVNDSGKLSGMEFEYQHMYKGIFDGFGTTFNYTYLDSKTPNGLPIPQMSRHSANAVVYYEKYDFGARLAYNWRDRHLTAAQGFRGRPQYYKAIGQLDLSLHYNVNENLTVTFEGLNLTEESLDSYVQIEERILDHQRLDKLFQFGLIARF